MHNPIVPHPNNPVSISHDDLPHPITKKYAKLNGVDINIDVYLPPNKKVEHQKLPALIFFHGGALVVGERLGGLESAMWMLEMAMKHNLIFVSADYRLLQPSTAHDQVEDVKALFSYLTSEKDGPHLPHHTTIDGNRIAVIGLSAGGHIARLACLYASPKPRAFFSLFGLGSDWFADWWIFPKDAPVGHEPVTEEDVAKVDQTKVTSNTPAKYNMDTSTVDDPTGRYLLSGWWGQNGIYLNHVVGATTGDNDLPHQLRALPYAQRGAHVPEAHRKVFPELHIDAHFPPTILIHGAADATLPVQESIRCHTQLKEAGVKSVLHVVEGADHGMVKPGTLELVEGVKELYAEAFMFLKAEIDA